MHKLIPRYLDDDYHGTPDPSQTALPKAVYTSNKLKMSEKCLDFMYYKA